VKESVRRDLVLESLANGFPAIPEVAGLNLAQAGAVCLDQHGHPKGVEMRVSGDFAEIFNLYWPDVTDQMRRFWNDAEVATEHGAYGIACLLIRSLTPFTVIERSRKGTGFDYWLGSEGDFLFQKKARLEVSGIGKGSAQQIAYRVNVKLKQTARSDGTLPAYVIVVEFSAPTSQVVRKALRSQ
jgi:hypothetical protein